MLSISQRMEMSFTEFLFYFCSIWLICIWIEWVSDSDSLHIVSTNNRNKMRNLLFSIVSIACSSFIYSFDSLLHRVCHVCVDYYLCYFYQKNIRRLMCETDYQCVVLNYRALISGCFFFLPFSKRYPKWDIT